MLVFRCLGCGRCCTLSPITLLPHEVHVLVREAKRLGIDIDFEPGYMIYDTVSRTYIVLSYHLKLDKNHRCPFLVGNKCILHGRYKPYTCRSFPYVPKEIRYIVDRTTKTIAHKSIYGVSTACVFVKRYSKTIEEVVRKHGIQGAFPYEYRSAFEAENWRRWYMASLTLLWRYSLVDLYSDVEGRGGNRVNAYDFVVARLVVLRSLISK